MNHSRGPLGKELQGSFNDLKIASPELASPDTQPCPQNCTATSEAAALASWPASWPHELFKSKASIISRKISHMHDTNIQTPKKITVLIKLCEGRPVDED